VALAGTAIDEQLERLQKLAQAVANHSLRGLTWYADLSLDAVEKIRVLRATAKVNLALLPKGDDLRLHLGANWVDLDEEIYALVLRIGRELES
jgi:hypothetical protein